MNLVTVVGARPQFIKAATISRALRDAPAIKETLVHTGQHYDPELSAVFFDELDISPPSYNLGIGSGPHGWQTGRMLEAIGAMLQKEPPDWVLVYGDTNSTLAGALAAAKLGIKVAHVEAGLRAFDRSMPEEINRVLTDHASDLLFAPTDAAVGQLRREGIRADAVHQVGDVMFDAAVYYGQAAEQNASVLANLGLERGGYLVATVHRAENTRDPQRLASIAAGLAAVAQAEPLVLPLHPGCRDALHRLGLLDALRERLLVIPPVGYLDMIELTRHARAIITDSGGLQKEAFFHRVPCVTLRDRTEWLELVEHGYNCLVGADPERLQEAIARIDGSALDWGRALYGDGHAAERIVRIIAEA